MEFRMYITVPGLPVKAEGAWEPLIEALERDHAELGPVIGWQGEDVEIVMSADAADEAEATETAVAAVVSALHSSDLGDWYPTGLRVEPEADPVPA